MLRRGVASYTREWHHFDRVRRGAGRHSARLQAFVLRQNSTILCIDEDLSSLVDLKTSLELDGRKVLITTSPRHGLQLLASQQVDGVILDYCMPLIHARWTGDHGDWSSWADLLPPPGGVA